MMSFPSKSEPTLSMASLFAFLLLLIASSSPCVCGGDKLTAYEVLQKFDFPVGLLPTGVTGYEIDDATGKFSAYLNATCKFTIESYELEYKSTISGVITRDKISSLKGIQVKVLILWLNIVEVIHDGDELQFSVGIASANFLVSNFYECPSCGCGFDCVNENEKRIKLNHLVSSA